MKVVRWWFACITSRPCTAGVERGALGTEPPRELRWVHPPVAAALLVEDGSSPAQLFVNAGKEFEAFGRDVVFMQLFDEAVRELRLEVVERQRSCEELIDEGHQ